MKLPARPPLKLVLRLAAALWAPCLAHSAPAHPSLPAPLLAGRGSVAPARSEQNKWYHATIEVAGDDMRVWLDGAQSAYLKSPGIAHETKSSFHFTVTGPGVLFDDVKISRAR
jgi:hypothetical protein